MGFKGKALNISCPVGANKVRTYIYYNLKSEQQPISNYFDSLFSKEALMNSLNIG